MNQGSVPVENGAPARIAVEDPWGYVYKNFYGLAMYYANIYAKAVRRPECFEDFRNEMLYAMVECFVKYGDRPREEIVKILKTVPRNYFGSRIMVKEFQAPRVDLEWLRENIVVVENAEHFEFLYDRYYDRFLDEYFRLGAEAPESDERKVLFEILYPSADFAAFLKGSNITGGVSKTLLRDYFQAMHKWSRGYFEQVFRGIRLDVDWDEQEIVRIDEMTEA
jgi:hypothetical protein